MSATSSPRLALWRAAPVHSPSAAPNRIAHGGMLLCAVAWCQLSWAQSWTIEPAVTSQVSWANNTLLGEGPAQSDLVLEVRPSVVIRREGSRFKVSGAAALDSAVFANGTRPNRALPQGNLNARLEAIERWFFLDASARATQSSTDPFRARTSSGAAASLSNNTTTTTEARISPNISGSIDAATRYSIRSDNAWTRESVSNTAATNSGSGGGGSFGRHSASIEHDPMPVGGRVEIQRDTTRYRNGFTDPITSDSARLILNAAVVPDTSAGLRVGYLRGSFLTSADNGLIYGAQAKWSPSARTTLSGEAEKRQYSSTWDAGFKHRMQRLAFSLSYSRAAQTTPQAVFELPATGSVALLLDAILARTISDPAERARAVQKLMIEQGLPDSTTSPTTINSPRLSQVTSSGGSIALTGVRNTVVLSGFRVRTTDLPGSTVLATNAVTSNNMQQGLGLAISHQLSPVAGLSAVLDWSSIRSAGTAVAAETTERGLRVQCDLRVTPKTNALAGLRYRSISSNVVVPGYDFSLFAGASHRF